MQSDEVEWQPISGMYATTLSELYDEVEAENAKLRDALEGLLAVAEGEIDGQLQTLAAIASARAALK